MMADEDDIDQEDLEVESDVEGEEEEEIGDDLDDVAVGEPDVEVEVEVEAEAETEAETEEEEAEPGEAVSPRRVAARSRTKREESEALHTVAAREDLRRKLAADVEAFLKRGGAIQDVPQDVRAEAPKKSDSTYGRGSV
jgi:hypothetical protein